MTVALLQAFCFGAACLGAISHLNELSDASWRKRWGYSLVAGGCLGSAIEPFWPTLEYGAALVLGAGLLLLAWPIIWRDIRRVLRRPLSDSMSQRHEDLSHGHRRIERQ